jgi:uncharacterized repeat protein (TIGR03803 family)
MKTKNLLRMRAAALWLASGIVILAPPARGQTLEVLHSFRLSDGRTPQCSLVQGSDGNFYGTTIGGGNLSGNSFGWGTVFKMTPNGTLTTLVSFNNSNGNSPQAGLVQGSDGSFYGTTQSGGNLAMNSGFGFGTVFNMTADGTLTTLVAFNNTNGASPSAGLVQGKDGNLYGTAQAGGDLSLNGGYGYGTVFKITTNGALTTLVQFNLSNGASPQAPLVQGTDGGFYGTTSSGGAYGNGTVFKVTTNGALTTMLSFDNNTLYPLAGLTQASDGNFYGTTYRGGTFSRGTVFRMTPGGALTVLVSFTTSANGNPRCPPIQASDGNFYGTTSGLGSSQPNVAGIVYRMMSDGTWTTLVSFTGNNGLSSAAALVLGSDGNLYGTTVAGGDLSLNNGHGLGTVFRIVMPPPPPTLNAAQSGNELILSWPTNVAFSLQSAPFVTGAFTKVPGATSPYTNSMTAPQQYFRLQAN